MEEFMYTQRPKLLSSSPYSLPVCDSYVVPSSRGVGISSLHIPQRQTMAKREMDEILRFGVWRKRSGKEHVPSHVLTIRACSVVERVICPEGTAKDDWSAANHYLHHQGGL